MSVTAICRRVGRKPELAWVPVEKIRVDSNYQRELRPARVAQILREFAWDKFEPVMLAEQPDGTFTVYDGQHRVEAARMHPDVAEVPAAINKLDGSSDEAGAFLSVNLNRTAVSTVEKFWAGMIRVREVLAAAGCEVIQAQGVKPAANKTTAVTAVQRAIARYGDSATTQACKMLVASWSKDPTALGGTSIQALARLVRNNKATFKPERMVEKLRGTDRKTLAAQAETLRKIGGGDATLNLTKALVEICNKQLQMGHISIGVKA